MVFASLKTNTAVVVDTSKISFQNKPVSWVEEESCGDYRVTGTVQLCGLPVNSAIEALRYEYKPKADKTIWEYIHDRYNSISVTSLEQFIGRSTVWSIAGGGCSEQCCCKEGVDSATWSVDLAFASEAEALSFKEYLSDTLSYYVAFIKNTCTVVEAGEWKHRNIAFCP